MGSAPVESGEGRPCISGSLVLIIVVELKLSPLLLSPGSPKKKIVEFQNRRNKGVSTLCSFLPFSSLFKHPLPLSNYLVPAASQRNLVTPYLFCASPPRRTALTSSTPVSSATTSRSRYNRFESTIFHLLPPLLPKCSRCALS